MNEKQRLDWFIVEVEEILKSLKARQKLDEGFNGMGSNILIERACGVDMALWRLERLIKKFKIKSDDECNR